MAENRHRPGPIAEFAADFIECWNHLPNKAFFLVLLSAWILLFQFLGNGTFGYINSPSLFRWMWVWYTSNNWEEGHGVLVAAAVAALFYWKRRELLAVPHRTWWPGLVLLAGSLTLHVLGYLVQQPRICIMGLFGGLFALMGLAWGPAFLRASFFPFFLLAFCIPFTTLGGPVTALTFYLRVLVAKLVVVISGSILGLDVVREGTQLYNSTHTFGYDVAAACSGIRSLFAIFALSTIYGFMTFSKYWKRLLMMAAAFPLAVLGNMVRMLTIIVTAECAGQASGDFVHENAFFSLLPYVPALLGVMALGHWLREPPVGAALPLNPTKA